MFLVLFSSISGEWQFEFKNKCVSLNIAFIFDFLITNVCLIIFKRWRQHIRPDFQLFRHTSLQCLIRIYLSRDLREESIPFPKLVRLIQTFLIVQATRQHGQVDVLNSRERILREQIRAQLLEGNFMAVTDAAKLPEYSFIFSNYKHEALTAEDRLFRSA